MLWNLGLYLITYEWYRCSQTGALTWPSLFSSQESQPSGSGGRLQTAVLEAECLTEVLSVARPSGECQQLKRPHCSWQGPPRAHSWGCCPEWAGLAVDPPTNFHPIVDNILGYSFGPILKQLYFEHLTYARHNTLYT